MECQTVLSAKGVSMPRSANHTRDNLSVEPTHVPGTIHQILPTYEISGIISGSPLLGLSSRWLRQMPLLQMATLAQLSRLQLSFLPKESKGTLEVEDEPTEHARYASFPRGTTSSVLRSLHRLPHTVAEYAAQPQSLKSLSFFQISASK